jgi:hypothetical protein
MQEKIKFHPEQKSSQFLIEIMTLVPSANTGSDTEFIPMRKIIYIYYEQ